MVFLSPGVSASAIVLPTYGNDVVLLISASAIVLPTYGNDIALLLAGRRIYHEFCTASAWACPVYNKNDIRKLTILL